VSYLGEEKVSAKSASYKYSYDLEQYNTFGIIEKSFNSKEMEIFSEKAHFRLKIHRKKAKWRNLSGRKFFYAFFA
jgi:hypothetical protein